MFKDIKIKIKEIYLPFLLITIGTILFYSLFRWTFDIKLGLLPLKKDLLNFWIPCFIPWIPVLIWLRRRIRILAVRGKQDNGHFLYQIAMVAAIAIPTMIIQNYLEKGSYELIEVSSPNEIQTFKNEKYFNINTFEIDKELILPYFTTRSSGRNNSELTFYLYLACPFKNTEHIWYGLDYRKGSNSNSGGSETEAAYERFLNQSEKEFESYDFQSPMYFEKLGYSDDLDGYLMALKESKSPILEANQILLIPQLEPFDQRLGDTFFWIFGSFGIGILVVFLMILFPKIEEQEFKGFKADKPLKEDDLREFLEFLNPFGTYKATAILILLNLTVFILVTFYGLNIVSPSPQELLEVGGNRRSEVISGDYWRLLSSVFLHAGFHHLFMNLFGLGFGGYFLERTLGPVRLIISFILCGIFASLTSIYWYENTVSVGASGAIFGIYGLILAFSLFKIYPDNTREMTWPLLIFYVGISLLFGFFGNGNTDNAAHIGGLISGLILGFIAILIEKDRLIKNAS